MATEQCPICGEHVAFSNTVHVMLNPRDDGGVIDFYVCRECYEADIEPLFADAIAAAADEESAGSEGFEDTDDSTDQDEEAPGDVDGPESADSGPAEEATPDASSSSE